MTSIGLRGLTLERPGFRLGPLTLELAPGSSTALVGPSGAGKTTLLRCMAGLQAPDAGEVVLGGELASRGREVRLAAEVRGIGFVFQRGALWPHMTAAEHLRFVAPDLDRAAALARLERVGLSAALADRRPGELSGGEAQRLALARALAPAPRILLLDEPLASVDAHLRGELALLVREVVAEAGLTAVVVTHEREGALAMADDLAVLAAGRLVEHGAAVELLRAPRSAFTASFLGGARRFEVGAGANGTLSTLFGTAPRPAGEGPWSLVVMPGDLAPGPGPRARVLRSEPDLRGYRVHAELRGQPVEFASETPLPRGAEVDLQLVGAPRILPDGPGGVG